MGQADNLLNNITAMQNMSRLSMNSDTEEHIVIGNDRIIHVPDILRKVAVQFDHCIETVTFDCPRYWDKHDMSKMIVYVNYMRSDGAVGKCQCENVRVDEIDDTIMHFEWTVTRNVSLTNGPIRFLVCVKKINTEGNEENHWNTELNDEMYVVEGLECDETLKELYPDVYTQIIDKANRLSEYYNVVLNKVDNTIFTPNFETGNLEYTSSAYTFDINETTGNLEWSPNSGALEDAIREAIPGEIDERFDDTNERIDSFGSILEAHMKNCASSDAEANVIDTIKVNGVELTPIDKAVDIQVPTKISELDNDTGLSTSDPATPISAGLMSAEDKTKLDGIDDNAEANIIDTIKVNGVELTPTDKVVDISVPTKISQLDNDINLPTDEVATPTSAGLMSAEDKTKLDGIGDNANNYTHPTYTPQTSGLYKITVDGTGHVSSVTAVTKADITNLGIPGTDTNTTYSVATTSANGLMSSTDKAKLDGLNVATSSFDSSTGTLYLVTK